MRIGFKSVVASAVGLVLTGGASLAQAQPEYAPGYLPPPPYAYDQGYHDEGYSQPGPCGGSAFTLLGAHAGVTVLGVDLGAGAHLGVPTGGSCGYDGGHFVARPHFAPPAAYGEPAPPPYGYGPPPGRPAYGDPCACAPGRW